MSVSQPSLSPWFSRLTTEHGFVTARGDDVVVLLLERADTTRDDRDLVWPAAGTAGSPGTKPLPKLDYNFLDIFEKNPGRHIQ